MLKAFAVALAAFVTASCEKQGTADSGKLAGQVESLRSRVAELENRAAELDKLRADPRTRAAPAPGLDEARVREIVEETAEEAVRRSAAEIRAQIKRTAATPEARARKKAEAVGKKAGLDEGKVRELGEIFLARDKAYADIKQKIKAGELEKEQSKSAFREARQTYNAALDGFLGGLTEEARAKAEPILKPQKRHKEKKEKRPRPEGEKKKRARKAKDGREGDGAEAEGGADDPIGW